MKKIKLFALPLVAALCLGGAACTKTAADEAPEISGVADRTCATGAVCDLLEGVAALDKEDGDITPSMEITVDGNAVDGCYAVFDEEKDYKVSYKATDSKGHVAEETAYISAISRDVYMKFDLINPDGFEVKTAGAAKLASQSVIGDGAASLYTFKVSGAAADTDAVLTRTYRFLSGTDYTVKYYVKSNVAGTAKAKINDGQAIDLPVAEGDNALTLTYSVPDGEEEETDVKIDILFGGLGADIVWTFDKAVAEHKTESEPSDEVTFVKGTNVHDRFDGTAGEVTVSQDGKSATLKITSASAERWRGGMFINTGLNLSAGIKYTVSYDLTAEKTGFGIALENKQWDAERYAYASIGNAGDMHQENEITPDKDGGLWLYVESGDAENTITVSNLKITGDTVNRPFSATVSFNNTNVEARIDNDGGNSALAGSVDIAGDNSSATLKITEKCSYNDRWRGGMFINTGIKVNAGNTYHLSFDIQAANNNPYDVCIQKKQWCGDEEFIDKIESPANGKVEKDIVITDSNAGDLWLYIRSGDNVNEITISEFKVTSGAEAEVQTVTETFTCGNLFKMFAYKGAPNYVQWVDGKLIFDVEKFGDTDWHNKIEGPQFFVDTSGVEFIISFKAKATAPVLCTWVGPKSGGWDPNLIWQQFRLSETESVYTFKGNESDMSNHQFEWQFGFAPNIKYENVRIEISDIVIYWQNGILDD